jgi:transcriptional regulator with XRE-family HTH domain
MSKRNSDASDTYNTPIYFREWREYAGLSQKQMGLLMRLTASQVSRIEAGKRPFTQAYLEDFHIITACQFLWSPLMGPPPQLPEGQAPQPLDEQGLAAFHRDLDKRYKLRAREQRAAARAKATEASRGQRSGPRKI